MNLLSRLSRTPGNAIRKLFGIACPFNHMNFKPFIVLGRSRVGSNMLIAFLNSHSHIRAEGEVFKKLVGRKYEDILARVFAKQPYYVKAKGFKLFYYHPLDERCEDFWNALVKMENLCVIHLKRRNIFRTLVSKKIADLEDIWTRKTSDGLDSRKNRTVSFTVQEVDDDIRRTRSWEKEASENFRNHPLLDVYYEDLVANRIEFKRVTEFLGVRYGRPHTRLIKQNPGKLSDLVSNYDELKTQSQDKEWRHFLDD